MSARPSVTPITSSSAPSSASAGQAKELPAITCGLEIHQQLDTRKLFCGCPSDMRDDEPHFQIVRTLRAAAGETGEVDAAAAHEQKKNRRIIYQGYRDTTCLVETDEEPPHRVTNAALDTCLMVATLLHCRIADTVQFMRKTVVDGSNTSGFQRTALIATDGHLNVDGARISIPTVCLEEDAARIIAQDETSATYRLDRLGVPLIEIATGPEIHSAQQAKDVAAHIGMILRSTSKVKRGLGTIRQDVNISVAGGVRVEIKGAQDLRLIPTLVTLEAQRQVQVLSLFAELERRQAVAHETIHTLTHVFETSASKLISRTIKDGGAVMGIRLEGFAGMLGTEIQPGRRLGTELSDYAKMRGVLGLIHSDEDLRKYSFTESEIARVREELGSDPETDAFILIADREHKAYAALLEVIARANHHGLLKEVRRANEDGTSSFLRPMPGAARMYPETDVPLIVPDTTGIVLPELIEAKIARFGKSYALPADLATEMAKNHPAFEDLARAYANVKPIIIANFLAAAPGEVKATFGIEADADAHAHEILALLDKGRIAKEALVELLGAKARGQELDLSRFASVSDEELATALKGIASEHPDLNVQALMGEAMKRYRGKVDGKRIMHLLQSIVKKS